MTIENIQPTSSTTYWSATYKDIDDDDKETEYEVNWCEIVDHNCNYEDEEITSVYKNNIEVELDKDTEERFWDALHDLESQETESKKIRENENR